MRSTYYATEDKQYLKKAVKTSLASYIIMLSYIGFFIWWENEYIGVLYDYSRYTDIMFAMLFNFIFSLTIVIVIMISLMYIQEYNTTKPIYDKITYVAQSIKLLNIALIPLTIIFSFLNISNLIYLS